MVEILTFPLDERLAATLHSAIESTLRDVFQFNTQSDKWCIGQNNILQPLDSLEVCTIDMRQADTPCGAFVAAFSREIVQKVMQQYGSDSCNDQKMIDDAVGEMTNMIFGVFKTAINKMGYHLVMDIPHPFYENKKVLDIYAGSEKMVLPFFADGHKGQIIIAQKQ